MAFQYTSIVVAELKPLLRDLEKKLEVIFATEFNHVGSKQEEGYIAEDKTNGSFLEISITDGFFWSKTLLASIVFNLHSVSGGSGRFQSISVQVLFNSTILFPMRARVIDELNRFNAATHLHMTIKHE